MALADTSVAAMCLEGEAGVGKTHFANSFAKYWNAEILFAQCHTETSGKTMLYDFDPRILVDAVSSRGTSCGLDAVREGYLVQALRKSQTGRVVLVLDEFDKAGVECDTLLLDYLQSCRIFDPMLGDIFGVRENLVVIITSNGRREFDDALGRRWVKRVMPFPSESEMLEIIKKMLGDAQIPSETIKFGVHIMYWYRSQKPKKSLVQNEIVRILLMGSTMSQADFADVLPTLFSPYQTDHKILETKGLKYIAGKLHSNES